MKIPKTTWVGIHAFTVPQSLLKKNINDFPLPKDNFVAEDHKNKAKMYCNTVTNAVACESAGYTLNTRVDTDMACRWGIETDTAQTAALIGGIGEQTKDIPVIGDIVDLFSKPVAGTVQAAGKIPTCHFIQLPGTMAIEEFYKQEKAPREPAQPAQTVAPVQPQPAQAPVTPAPAPQPQVQPGTPVPVASARKKRK